MYKFANCKDTNDEHVSTIALDRQLQDCTYASKLLRTSWIAKLRDKTNENLNSLLRGLKDLTNK